MSTIINADTSDGLKFTSDTSGEIKLQSAGADIVSVTANGIDVTGGFTVDTNTLYVDSTNNRVGIGTSSPADPLQISHATTSRMRFSETTNSLTLNVGQWSAKNRIEGSGGSDLIISNYDASNPIAFYTGSGGGNVERMRIDSSGSLLAGKTGLDTTNAGLWINSNIANGYGRINFIKGTSSGTGATASCGFYYNGTSVGTIVNTSTATAFNTSSDYRLKENVSPMSGSIDRLKQLKPSTWSWKLDGSHGEGFLAHEAQTVVPEAITGTHNEVDDDDNPVYQGIDQSKLVPLLTAALQEAITKIEDLETRIQTLESV